MKIKTVALIGMGAVGTVYGNSLYKRYGSDFAVILGKSRKDKLQKQGFTLNNNNFYPNIFSEGDNYIKFDLIIFCVKNYQLEGAIGCKQFCWERYCSDYFFKRSYSKIKNTCSLS